MSLVSRAIWCDIIELTDLENVHHGRIGYYLECALVLHQQVPTLLGQLPSALRTLVQNDFLLSRALLRSLKAAIEHDNTGIDDAIRKTWPGFARLANTTWHPVAGTPWVTCRTSTSQGMQSRVVHVNLLDGSIYVDGASFQALPKDILQHSLYQEVFPTRVCIASSSTNDLC